MATTETLDYPVLQDTAAKETVVKKKAKAKGGGRNQNLAIMS